MKKAKIFAGLLFALLLTGCTGKNTVDSQVVGKWASAGYDSSIVLNFKANGTASYKGQRYKYYIGEETLDLKKGNTVMRCMYELNLDKMILYLPNVYEYGAEGTPEVDADDIYEINGNQLILYIPCDLVRVE